MQVNKYSQYTSKPGNQQVLPVINETSQHLQENATKPSNESKQALPINQCTKYTSNPSDQITHSKQVSNLKNMQVIRVMQVKKYSQYTSQPVNQSTNKYSD